MAARLEYPAEEPGSSALRSPGNKRKSRLDSNSTCAISVANSCCFYAAQESAAGTFNAPPPNKTTPPPPQAHRATESEAHSRASSWPSRSWPQS